MRLIVAIAVAATCSLTAGAAIAVQRQALWRGDKNISAAADYSLSPSPHGRTRITVFPLIRLFGLKAETASSSGAMLPM